MIALASLSSYVAHVGAVVFVPAVGLWIGGKWHDRSKNRRAR